MYSLLMENTTEGVVHVISAVSYFFDVTNSGFIMQPFYKLILKTFSRISKRLPSYIIYIYEEFKFTFYFSL